MDIKSMLVEFAEAQADKMQEQAMGIEQGKIDEQMAGTHMMDPPKNTQLADELS